MSLVAAVVLLELSLRFLVGEGYFRLPAPPPATSGKFWDGDHPVYGVWHRPDAELEHQSPCFDVHYRTNSVGARDKERALNSAGRRVVVLGDSFIEGWGIPDGERLTDLLERDTKIEHLNFGMAHQGPYQYYLVYRDLARRFSHECVLVGVLPVNDFFDLDYELALCRPSYEYRYRPYLVGKYPNYHEVDYHERFLSGALRRNSYACNAVAYAIQRLEGRDRPERIAPPGLVESYFYDYSQKQFDLLRYSLEKIQEAADGRPVAVLLLPSRHDFQRYRQAGESPLAAKLRELCSSRGMRLVDLLAPMYRATNNPGKYYLPCDYHWSPVGNSVAAEIVERELKDVLLTTR